MFTDSGANRPPAFLDNETALLPPPLEEEEEAASAALTRLARPKEWTRCSSVELRQPSKNKVVGSNV